MDFASKAYDWMNVLAIVLNVAVSILYTFDSVKVQYGSIIIAVEMGMTII